MINKIFSILSPKALLTVTILLALFFSFSLYVYTEKQIDSANEIRHLSYQLADQLRQSSDDQTRMARTYVVTGESRFKRYHQEILDIRDGKIPRPKGYFQAYWDIVIAKTYAMPIAVDSNISLLGLMRQSGFTQEEMLKLSKAKANIDEITALELNAFQLVKVDDLETKVSREKALEMLHDAHYHQAKEEIMLPINTFYGLMDKRTISDIHKAERIAFIFRQIFILAAIWSVYILWRANRELHMKLGASVNEVQAYLRKIGSGDLSNKITIPLNMEHSILNGLAEMQDKLRAFDVERQRLENAREDALSRLRKKASQEIHHRLEQSKFIVMLTHELKNPLAAIKLAVSSLGDTKCTNVDFVSLGHIAFAASDMDAIIDRCIQADKFDQGGLQLNLSNFLLLPYVNDIAVALHALPRLDVNIPVQLSIRSDSMMLRLVISNLLENALKYSSPKSVITIDATSTFSESGQSGVLIRLSNNIGKAGRPDELHVFERYYRSSAAQRQSGTGLGLWLVKSIVIQLGGEVLYVPRDDYVEFQVWMPT